MRLSDEQLKAGWLHPNRIVRGVVAKYFRESFTRDPDVTRWAIRGVEEFGWKNFLVWPHPFCALPMVEQSSFEWVCQQLERTDAGAPSENQKWHLSMMLADGDVSLLEREQSRLLAMDVFRPEDRERIVTRLQIARLDPAECWRRLEEHCRLANDAAFFEDAKVSEAELLLEPLTRAGDRFVPNVLEVLHRKGPSPDETGPDDWIIGMAIILAGHLRLEEAAPLIWKFWECDWDWYNEQVMYSLTRIGTPSVVRLAQERYPQSEWYVRNYAHNLFENILCEEAVEAIETVVASEDNEFLRGQLGIAAAAQFDDRLVPLALRLWNECPSDRERDPIREFLVAFSYLSGWELPERDAWERDIHESDERVIQMRDSDCEWLRNLFTKVEPYLKDTKTLADKFDKIDEQFVETTPLRRATIVGRNDPCPCGSGKKYKKCCLYAATE